MSDDTKGLVERLRDHENEGVTGSDRFHLRNEAADTIERLERELAEAREVAQAKSEIRDEFYAVRQERNALAERCEKLREALVRVRAHTSHLWDAERDLLVGLLASIERITDAALRAAPKDAP